MGEFLEMLMVVSFGISWPISIIKTVRSKRVEGKSILFSILIWIGYIFGTTSKIVRHSITYVFFFYIANLIFVSLDILLYMKFRRKKGEISTEMEYLE